MAATVEVSGGTAKIEPTPKVKTPARKKAAKKGTPNLGVRAEKKVRRDGVVQTYHFKPNAPVKFKFGNKWLHGRVLSEKGDYQHVPGVGTFHIAPSELLESDQKPGLDARRGQHLLQAAADEAPEPPVGSIVAVKGEKSILRRELITPLKGKKDAAKITVHNKTGHKHIKETYRRDQIVGPWMPALPINSTGQRKWKIERDLFTPKAQKRRADTREYIELLPAKQKKRIEDGLNRWREENATKLVDMCSQLVAQWPAADKTDLLAAALAGADYGYKYSFKLSDNGKMRPEAQEEVECRRMAQNYARHAARREAIASTKVAEDASAPVRLAEDVGAAETGD